MAAQSKAATRRHRARAGLSVDEARSRMSAFLVRLQLLPGPSANRSLVPPGAYRAAFSRRMRSRRTRHFSRSRRMADISIDGLPPKESVNVTPVARAHLGPASVTSPQKVGLGTSTAARIIGSPARLPEISRTSVPTNGRGLLVAGCPRAGDAQDGGGQRRFDRAGLTSAEVVLVGRGGATPDDP